MGRFAIPRLLRSARGRILASFVVLLAGATLLSDVALREALLSRTEQRVDRALTQEVDEFRRLATDGRDPRTGQPFRGDVGAIFDVYFSRNVPGDGEATFAFLEDELFETSGNVPLGAPVIDRIERLGGLRGSARGELDIEGRQIRYLATPVVVRGERRGLFVATGDLETDRKAVDDALQVAIITSLVVLALGALIAFAIAGRVLRPLRDLTDTARSIDAETDLTRRIPAEGNDEIAELAQTFNSMLDRIESSFQSRKDFISDAGHELRTPITIIRGHLELLGDDPRERRETVALVTDELDRMSRFVDDLLLLAKAGQPDFLRLEALDLDVVADELLHKAEALAPRDWRLNARHAEGRIVADRQRLTQAVMNLAQNATHHTGPDEVIELGAAIEGDEARLWVADHGPGVSKAARERIFERFVRAPAAHRSEGAGLGLAIVRAIAEGHGGRIELETAEGIGSRFTIVIPTEPRPEGDPSDGPAGEPTSEDPAVDDDETKQMEARP